MHSVEPSNIDPHLGVDVHRPRDLLGPIPAMSPEQRIRVLRRWVKHTLPMALIPAPLIAVSAWGVLAESWTTYRKLRAQVHAGPAAGTEQPEESA